MCAWECTQGCERGQSGCVHGSAHKATTRADRGLAERTSEHSSYKMYFRLPSSSSSTTSTTCEPAGFGASEKQQRSSHPAVVGAESLLPGWRFRRRFGCPVAARAAMRLGSRRVGPEQYLISGDSISGEGGDSFPGEGGGSIPKKGGDAVLGGGGDAFSCEGGGSILNDGCGLFRMRALMLFRVRAAMLFRVRMAMLFRMRAAMLFRVRGRRFYCG